MQEIHIQELWKFFPEFVESLKQKDVIECLNKIENF